MAVSHAADVEVEALPRPPAQAGIIERLIAGYFEEARDEENIANAVGSGNSVAVETAYTILLAPGRRDAAVCTQPWNDRLRKSGIGIECPPAVLLTRALHQARVYRRHGGHEVRGALLRHGSLLSPRAG